MNGISEVCSEKGGRLVGMAESLPQGPPIRAWRNWQDYTILNGDHHC